MKLATPAVESVFYAAMELDTPSERAAYLDNACGDDTDFRRRVEKLLAAHHQAGSFLEAPSPAPAATTDDPLSERPGTVIGPYKLLEQIGEGGFGVVFLAEQTHPVRRKVALKILKAGMDTRQVVARFEAERQALAIMDHPNIAKVFDGGMTGLPIDDCRLPIDGGVQGIQSAIANRQSAISSGRPYFVMELVKGRPITDHCDKNELSLRQRLELFVPVCQAVQHAHQKGIIHRDLKPSNVLVATSDGKPVPKVIDFGVAKALGQELTDKTLHTALAQMIGTPLYMSPEQAGEGNLDVDTRSDVYSLGVLLYELLTGTTPFEKERFKKAHIDEIRRIIREEEPPKPSTRLSSPHAPRAESGTRSVPTTLALARLLRGELDWIVMKCLEKDRNRRYETASGFAMDIQRYLANEPVLAGPPSARYRLRKFVRRNKGPVLAASAMVLLLIGGIIGTTWGMVRAEKARQAETARAEGERRAKEAEAEQRQIAEANELRANTERDRAETAKQIAQAVRDFLQRDLLGQANPTQQAERWVELGKVFALAENPTIKELLDRAAAELVPEKIEAKFPGQPLVQAEILRTVGFTYVGIGQYDKAITYLKRSSDLYQQELGRDDPHTLTTVHDLATACLNAGQTAMAIGLFEQIHHGFVEQYGPDDPETLTNLNLLALAYGEAGRTADAIALFEQVRDAQITKLGRDHRKTLNTLTNLAMMYRRAGKTAEAIALFEQVRDVEATKLGLDHPDTLVTLANLAVAYRHAGRTAEAIALFEQVRPTQENKLGPDHPDTLSTINNLAAAYWQAGRIAEAIALFERVRDAQVAKLGPDHPKTLTTLNNLAGGYWHDGKTAEAIALFEKVRDARRTTLGPDHRLTLITLNNLAGAYRDAGRTVEAIALFEQVRPVQEAKLGPDHPDTLTTQHNLAATYRDAARTAEAIALLEKVRDAQATKLGPDHPETLSTLAQLAISYRDAGKTAEAIALFQKVHAAQATKLGPDHPDTLTTLANLALTFLQQKKFTDAEPLLRAGLAILEVKQPDHWKTFSSRSMLGGALLGQQKFVAAEPLLLEGYEGMKQRAARIHAPAKIRLTEALERLVQLYDYWGKKAQADEWRKELESAKRRAEPGK